MAKPDWDVSVVNNGEQLAHDWNECGYPIPGELGDWIRAVEEQRNTVLVASKIGRVVGSVTIRWGGAHPMELEFADALSKIFPDQKSTPVIYGLHVMAKYRKEGAGTALMEGAEQEIIQNQDAPQRVALWFEENDLRLRQFYRANNYEYRKLIKLRNMPFVDLQGEWGMKDIEAAVMTKDLSA